MKKITGILLFILIHVLLISLQIQIQKQMHEWGQESEFRHTLVKSLDLMAFTQNSRGVFGASTNYYGYHYAKATSNPDRPLWHKVLFWENPYYITEPPEEWLYPPKY